MQMKWGIFLSFCWISLKFVKEIYYFLSNEKCIFAGAPPSQNHKGETRVGKAPLFLNHQQVGGRRRRRRRQREVLKLFNLIKGGFALGLCMRPCS